MAHPNNHICLSRYPPPPLLLLHKRTTFDHHEFEEAEYTVVFRISREYTSMLSYNQMEIIRRFTRRCCRGKSSMRVWEGPLEVKRAGVWARRPKENVCDHAPQTLRKCGKRLFCFILDLSVRSFSSSFNLYSSWNTNLHLLCESEVHHLGKWGAINFYHRSISLWSKLHHCRGEQIYIKRGICQI